MISRLICPDCDKVVFCYGAEMIDGEPCLIGWCLECEEEFRYQINELKRRVEAANQKRLVLQIPEPHWKM